MLVPENHIRNIIKAMRPRSGKATLICSAAVRAQKAVGLTKWRVLWYTGLKSTMGNTAESLHDSIVSI